MSNVTNVYSQSRHALNQELGELHEIVLVKILACSICLTLVPAAFCSFFEGMNFEKKCHRWKNMEHMLRELAWPMRELDRPGNKS